MALPSRGVMLAVVLLAATFAAAGCTKKDNPTPDVSTSTPTNGTGSTTTTTTSPTTPTTVTKPSVAPVTDKGSIQGPFEKSWKINVPSISPLDMIVRFNLNGTQAGVPPTAEVYLTLSGPDGKVIKSATIGLGGSANNVAWTLGTEVAAPGDYTLKATTQPPTGPAPTGLPSGGVAEYDLFMGVDY